MAREKERTFVYSNIPQKCFHLFEDMKSKEEFCDITFQIGSESISAHRVIITAAIPYFRDMLSGKKGAQTYGENIRMPDIDPSALKYLIEFAYSCRVRIDTENVRNLLTAACYLGVDEVREACCDFLVDCLEPNNVLNIREFASNLNCWEVLKCTDRYVKENFNEVSHTRDFLSCSLSYLKEVLVEDDLNVDNEEHVLEAVLKWAKYSPEDRNTELQELLCIIRMPLLTPLYLTNVVKREEIIRSSASCRDLMDEAKNYNLFPEMRTGTCSFPTEPRKLMKAAYISPKEEGQYIYKLSILQNVTVQRFDPMLETWSSKKSAPFLSNTSSTAELLNKIYFFDWGRALRYDEANNEYEFLDDMPTPRAVMGAVSLNGKIYICGGRVGSTAFSVVECFDPEKEAWTKVCSMRTSRWGSSAVALGEYLFVLGGQDNSSVHDSMERYDPVIDKWKNIPSMHTKRSFAGAAVLNGKIFVSGGKTSPAAGEGIIATAEVYDPVENRWEFISSMNAIRYNFALLACRKKLYAIGGLDGTLEYVHNFEIYDPASGEWKSGPSTDAEYFTSGAIVIPSSNVQTWCVT